MIGSPRDPQPVSTPSSSHSTSPNTPVRLPLRGVRPSTPPSSSSASSTEAPSPLTPPSFAPSAGHGQRSRRPEYTSLLPTAQEAPLPLAEPAHSTPTPWQASAHPQEGTPASRPPQAPQRRPVLRNPVAQHSHSQAAPPPQRRPQQQPPAFLPQHRQDEIISRRATSRPSSGAAAPRRAGSPSERAGVRFAPVAPGVGPTQSPRTPRPSHATLAPVPRPRRRRRFRFSFFILLLLAILIAWPIFLVTDANNNLKRVDALSGGADTPGTTYLLAGSDSREDGAVQDDAEGKRSDSIMLVHVTENGQASTVSIPRDTWVDIPGYGGNKINAAYSFEGPPLLVSTVEQLTGLTIDHYLEIGMGGVGNIVDAVGGIELCMDMDVNDEYSGLVWTSGCHVADGPTALAFSRMRYSDPLGDIGRAERQRQVVSKTVKTALSPSTLINPVSAFRLERAGATALTVDPNTSPVDIGRLALAFRQANAEGLTGAPPIVSLAYETEAGAAVLLVDDTAPDFFEAMRNGTLTPEDFKQDLL